MTTASSKTTVRTPSPIARAVLIGTVTAIVAIGAGSPVTFAADAEPSAQPSAEPTASTAQPASEPVFWSDVLVAGDCIDRPPEGTLPEPLSCDELHEEEIYAVGRLDIGPEEPYPGEDALGAMVSEQLCDAATLDFTGMTFDDIPFQTFLLYPTEEEWAAGDRGIMCAATPPEGTEQKLGTAAGGSLDTDAVLLARGSFDSSVTGEITDWVTVREGDTVSSLGMISDGRWDIARRRAWPLPNGFLFDATPRGAEDEATSTWAYDWTTREFTDLGSMLPGQELASSMVMDGTTVFAARRTADDDWDLFVVPPGGEVEPLADGPGDQHFPTFTPDGRQVVFHDDGDLVVIGVDGSDRRTLVERGSNAWESSVSPDGTQVAFASDHTGDDDIWLVGLAGGEPVNLTRRPSDEAWPTWSPDGERIFFQTDRLRPERSIPSLMVMNADGSEQSWLSGEAVGQVFVIDPAVPEEALASLLTLDDRYYHDPVEGEPGSVAAWEHSSGLLAAELPVGWRVTELDDGTGFLAAPFPSRFYDRWAADGVVATRHEDATGDAFFARIDDTAVASGCERSAGSDEPAAEEPGVLRLTVAFSCGEDGTAARVTARYDESAGTGVIIEDQRDGLPDDADDVAILDAIADSVSWS